MSGGNGGVEGPIKGGLNVECRLEFFENVRCQL